VGLVIPLAMGGVLPTGAALTWLLRPKPPRQAVGHRPEGWPADEELRRRFGEADTPGQSSLRDGVQGYQEGGK
jgi:hypothetical protein